MDSQTKDSNLKEKWEVSSNTTNYTLQSIVEQIEEGNKGKGGINLKPFYQREYKFTIKDESLLIESLLGGIPIPVIYMASDTSKIPHIMNVIDGQHRLMAVYRFLENKFKLKGLQKYEELNGLCFKELDPTIQNKLKYQISLSFQLIHIQNDPELEIEIFTRYNQGTNPLTKQEIRHVVYDSKFNSWLIELIKKLKENEKTKEIFNINKKRFNDKSIHQELYVMFGIYNNCINPNYSYSKRQEIFNSKNKNIKKYEIKNGINQEYFSSTAYVDEFMLFAKYLNEEESIKLIKECEEFINLFIDFLENVFLSQNIKYPLSKEIYQGNRTISPKMQTSILMIISSVFYKIKELKIIYSDYNTKKELKEKIARGFKESRFPKVTTSTTEPKLLTETIDKITSIIFDN